MNRLNETKFHPDDPLLTAFALGELEGDGHARIAAAVAADPALAAAVAEIRATSAHLTAALASEPLPALAETSSDSLNGKIVELSVAHPASGSAAGATSGGSADDDSIAQHRREPWRRNRKKVHPFPYFIVTSLAAACFVVAFIVFYRDHEKKEALRLAALQEQRALEARMRNAIVLDLQPGVAVATIPGVRDGNAGASGENPFLLTTQKSISSFPINVGTASYADIRRMLQEGRRPQRDDVRIEELINAFTYDYAPPAATDVSPIAASLEVASAPWAAEHRLVRIGLKAREAQDESVAAVAKDVTVQVAFNPARVLSYRLIGYESRNSANETAGSMADDAGDVAPGHTVTALYDVVPASTARKPGSETDELLTVTLHYTLPDRATSERAEFPLVDRGAPFADASSDFKFAAAVASFGMILRDSPNRGDASYEKLVAWAEQSGADARGDRSEFVGLISRAGGILR